MEHCHGGPADAHHGHGHENDQGVKAMLRYLRWAPQLWSSEVNNAAVASLDLKPDEVALDIGAGIGAGSVAAAKTGATIIAVEPTPYLRRILRLRCKLSRHGRTIRVEDGTAEHLPVADRSVNVVWAVNTMHHWNSPKMGAKEIWRVLAPGGRVFLVDEDFNDSSHPDFERFENQDVNSEPDKHHHDSDGKHHHGFTMVDAEEMGQFLRSAGFTDIDAGKRDLVGRPAFAVAAEAPAL